MTSSLIDHREIALLKGHTAIGDSYKSWQGRATPAAQFTDKGVEGLLVRFLWPFSNIILAVLTSL